MPAPATIQDFLGLIRKSNVVAPDRLDEFVRARRDRWQRLNSPAQAAAVLLKDGLLSTFQTKNLLEGRAKGFWIKKYLVLEDLGAGGMGRVFLCEQTPMHRLVAVKVLPSSTAPGALERFLREARASAALDHPNIVRAFDVDHEDRFHFLVMEFVDGSTLETVVERSGPIDIARACNYAAQAADGLHHAHLASWIHRDVKPGNLLVDRAGTVKVLDLGLARFALADEQLTKRFDDQHLLGTADYIAPEQTLPNHPVDSRADIYSLGATLFFLLAGRPPYVEGNVLQKLMCHQLSDPPALADLRPEVPKALAALVQRMMAKSPDQRPQTAEEVSHALHAFTEETTFPPLEKELVVRCARVQQLAQLAAVKSGPPPRTKLAGRKDRNGVPPAAVDAKKGKKPARSPKRPVLLAALLGGGVVLLATCVLAGWLGYGLLSGTAPTQTKVAVPVTPPKVDPAIAAGETVTPAEAAKKINETCTVKFVCRYVGFSNNKHTMFLNSESDYKGPNNFAIVVHGIDAEAAERAKELRRTYEGKTILVTGQVILFQGRPEIVLPELAGVRVE